MREKFIEKATIKHNGLYDYSKVEYTGSHSKVCIVDPVHGEFWQTPSNHLTGCGCPDRSILFGEIVKASSYRNDTIAYIFKRELGIDIKLWTTK